MIKNIILKDNEKCNLFEKNTKILSVRRLNRLIMKRNSSVKAEKFKRRPRPETYSGPRTEVRGLGEIRRADEPERFRRQDAYLCFSGFELLPLRIPFRTDAI